MSISTNTNTNAAELDAQLIAASEDGDTELVQLLIAAGADANAWGTMALGSAAYHGHCEVVKLLLESGADVHAMDDLVVDGHPEVVKTLTDWANK